MQGAPPSKSLQMATHYLESHSVNDTGGIGNAEPSDARNEVAAHVVFEVTFICHSVTAACSGLDDPTSWSLFLFDTQSA